MSCALLPDGLTGKGTDPRRAPADDARTEHGAEGASNTTQNVAADETKDGKDEADKDGQRADKLTGGGNGFHEAGEVVQADGAASALSTSQGGPCDRE